MIDILEVEKNLKQWCKDNKLVTSVFLIILWGLIAYTGNEIFSRVHGENIDGQWLLLILAVTIGFSFTFIRWVYSDDNNEFIGYVETILWIFLYCEIMLFLYVTLTDSLLFEQLKEVFGLSTKGLDEPNSDTINTFIDHIKSFGGLTGFTVALLAVLITYKRYEQTQKQVKTSSRQLDETIKTNQQRLFVDSFALLGSSDVNVRVAGVYKMIEGIVQTYELYNNVVEGDTKNSPMNMKLREQYARHIVFVNDRIYHHIVNVSMQKNSDNEIRINREIREVLQILNNYDLIEIIKFFDLRRNLMGLNPQNLDFSGLNLQKINFTNVNLNGFDMHEVDLTEAILILTNFNDTDLSRSNFTKSNLTRATFIGATLAGARFNDAVLTNANFKDAIVSWYKLRDAGNLDGVILTGCKRYDNSIEQYLDWADEDIEEALSRGCIFEKPIPVEDEAEKP